MSASNKVAFLLIGIVFIWMCLQNINLELRPRFPAAGEIAVTVAVAGEVKPQNQRRVFILAGQSNMAGRGGVDNRTWDGYIPPESRESDGILRLTADLRWEVAREPLHGDVDWNKTCGIGPGLVFANGLLEKGGPCFFNRRIGLVPCAVGGTSIREWCRGCLLYNNLVARANVAAKDGGFIEGILWYQGERDTVEKEDADWYRFRLEQLILDLRRDLQLPNLPFLEVVIGSAEGPWMDTVRGAQLGIDLPNVIKVDATGLPFQPDGLHLSSSAQVSLGQMMAHAFLNFIKMGRYDGYTQNITS